jgi:bifunctional non-homologous end joining protein LigD
MARIVRRASGLGAAKRSAPNSEPPRWIEPQLCKLVEKAPSGPGWVHEVKFDGYRMAARIDHGNVQLLTRSGLDWTEKYPETAVALAKLSKPPIAGPARSSISPSTFWSTTARLRQSCR